MASDYPFQGDAVALRAFEAADSESVDAYLNHPALAGCRNLPRGFDGVLPLSGRQVEQIIEKWQTRENGANLAVVLLATGELIGHIDCGWRWDALAPWLSITIAPSYQRQGYGSEAASLMLAYLFNQRAAHVVTSSYPDWNQAAVRFAISLGFTETGAMRRVGLRNGRPYDEIFADILRREWTALPVNGG